MVRGWFFSFPSEDTGQAARVTESFTRPAVGVHCLTGIITVRVRFAHYKVD